MMLLVLAGQTQVVCFSRHVNTKLMKLGLQNRMGKGQLDINNCAA
jgi:hypothetical protein